MWAAMARSWGMALELPAEQLGPATLAQQLEQALLALLEENRCLLNLTGISSSNGSF